MVELGRVAALLALGVVCCGGEGNQSPQMAETGAGSGGTPMGASGGASSGSPSPGVAGGGAATDGSAAGARAEAGSPNELDCDNTPARPTEEHGFGEIASYSARVLGAKTLSSGEAEILWRELPQVANGGEVSRMLFSRADARGALQPPEVVRSTTEQLRSPQLAAGDVSSTSVTLWIAEAGGALLASVRDELGEWTETSPVVEADTLITSYRAVVDDRGVTTVVWVEEEGASAATSSVHAARLEAGATSWSLPALLTVDSSSSPYIDEPRVQVLADGSVTVLWSQGVTAGFETWINRYDPNAAEWDGPIQLSVDGEYRPSLSASGSLALAVWAESYESGASPVFSSWLDANGWSAPLALDASGIDPDGMASAISPRGAALAVWQEDTTVELLRYAAYDPDAGSWSAPATLEYAAVDRPQHPTVTWVACRQAFRVEWEHYDTLDAYGAWYDPEGGFSAVEGPMKSGVVDAWGYRLHARYDEARREVVTQWLGPPQ